MTDSELRLDCQTQTALRELDLVNRAEVVTWATERLEEIGDMRFAELAGLSPIDLDRVDSQLSVLLAALGGARPTEFQRGMLAAAHVARQLRSGVMQPIDAAHALWSIARRAPASEPRLRTFVGLASEWDDDRDSRGEYEKEIRSAALDLEDWLLRFST